MKDTTVAAIMAHNILENIKELDEIAYKIGHLNAISFCHGIGYDGHAKLRDLESRRDVLKEHIVNELETQ